ncbi:MAG: hypothetical protein IPN20_20195 [Haliscomenobacter sp.]|nr:hypothetical protein [Haliscomenobacter sp.]MBP9881463.1 hypothetical protein [Chitinophagales bacterium]
METTKLSLQDFKDFQVSKIHVVKGGVIGSNGIITGSGVGTVDLEWESGHIECDVSTQGLGWGAGWDGTGEDPYVGKHF